MSQIVTVVVRHRNGTVFTVRPVQMSSVDVGAKSDRPGNVSGTSDDRLAVCSGHFRRLNGEPSYSGVNPEYSPNNTATKSSGKLTVNSFSTRLLSSCTDEYAHTYDISTYSVQQ